jgi:hypothetical protein
MAEREEQLKADLGLDGTAVVEPQRRRLAGGRALRAEPQYRAISAAPGSPAAALPPSHGLRTTQGTTPQAIASTPRRLDELPGGTPNRKDH